MNIINPVTITDAMIGVNSTVLEPSGSDAEWSNASVAYKVGQTVKRSTTRKRYRCLEDHTSAASPLPEADPTRWLDIGFAEYPWAPSTAYVAGDIVTRNTTTRKKYSCIAAHTSAASPVPEDNPTQWVVLGDAEQAWSGSAVSYQVGDVVARSTTHRKYKCAVAHTSAASPLPEDDPTRWVDWGPTDRWAPFDAYSSSAVLTSTSLTYVLQPGYVNALALYGLTGAQYSVTVKDEPGGATLFTKSDFLLEPPLGWYEYLFAQPRTLSKVVLTNLPIRPEAEITITVSAATGQPVGIGMIVVGDFVSLSQSGKWGGTEHGSSAEPVTYSYIDVADDGTVTIVRRHKATNLRCRVVMPREDADFAVSLVQQVLDVPVAWVATDQQGYTGLTTFGIGSGSMVYDSFGQASFEIFVKGLI